jgi:hypothetical protein
MRMLPERRAVSGEDSGPNEVAMPIATETLDDGRGLLMTGRGTLTGAEIIAAKRQLLADEAAIREVTFCVFEMLHIAKLDITVQEIHDIASIDRELTRVIPRATIAVIAPCDHDFGMARMWESIADLPGWMTKICRTVPEAEQWLFEHGATRHPLPVFPSSDR